MENEKLAGSVEGKTLGRRVALVEACQKIAQLPDLQGMPDQERDNHFQLIAANDVAPNDAVKLKVWLAFVGTIDLTDPKGRAYFLDAFMPFPDEPQETFDWFAPELSSIVHEALERDDPVQHQSSWGIEIDVDLDGGAAPSAQRPEDKPDWEVAWS